MAHNEDIDKIRLDSTVERVRKYKINKTENRTWYTLEIPMEEEWPAGDPFTRDRETLVIRLTKEEYKKSVMNDINEAFLALSEGLMNEDF
jgi:hypothetical protein